MSVRFYCQNCGHPLTAPEALRGAETHCENCGQLTRVPEQAQPAPTVEPLGPARYEAPPPAPKKDAALAGWSLGLGLASVVGCGCFTGLPAVILGAMALQRGQDRTLAVIGIVLGAFALLASGVVIPLVFLAG